MDEDNLNLNTVPSNHISPILGVVGAVPPDAKFICGFVDNALPISSHAPLVTDVNVKPVFKANVLPIYALSPSTKIDQGALLNVAAFDIISLPIASSSTPPTILSLFSIKIAACVVNAKEFEPNT